MIDDTAPDTRGGRIAEAVAVAVLTAIGTHVVDALAERWRKKRRRAKPKKAPPTQL